MFTLHQFLGVFTFHDSARSAQWKWALSGTRQNLASRMSTTALHRFTSLKAKLQCCWQANNVPRRCRPNHQPKSYLDKDKTKCVDKDKEPLGQFHAAATPHPTARWYPMQPSQVSSCLCAKRRNDQYWERPDNMNDEQRKHISVLINATIFYSTHQGESKALAELMLTFKTWLKRNW